MTVMRTMLVVLFAVCAVPVSAASAARHAATGYRVEFHDPVRGAEGVFTLDLIFSHRVGSHETEKALRLEVERIVRRRRPHGDVLASAWYSPTGSEVDEELITLPDGSSHLIYWRKIGKIITFNQYERRKAK